MQLGDVVVNTVFFLSGWAIARHYYKRSAADLYEQLRRQSADADRKDTLEFFELMLERSPWTAERIADRETWVCDQRSIFKIVSLGDFHDFDEEWTRRVPDNEHNAMSTVELRINDSAVRTLSFVSLDGGRYFVPLPRKVTINKQAAYCWQRSSLDFKVSRIVGRYYRFKNLEDTARFLDVEIVP